MMRLMGILLMVLGLCIGACHAEEQKQGQIPAAPLPVELLQLQPMKEGATALRVRAEVATTDVQHERGLMFRRRMDADAGMLFVWPEARVAKFWMRNTYLPLDMLFFRDGRLVAVMAWAKPLDETPVGPDEPVDMVLEVNGGYAAAHGITPGWRVVRPAR